MKIHDLVSKAADKIMIARKKFKMNSGKKKC